MSSEGSDYNKPEKAGDGAAAADSLGPETNKNQGMRKPEKKADETDIFRLIPHMAGTSKVKRSPVWMISFTDLMALMLTFFVLTYSMAEPEPKTWAEVTGSLPQGVSSQEGPRRLEGGDQVISLPRVTYNRALNLDYLAALLTTKLQDHRLLKDVSVLNQGDRLILSLPSDLLFEPGRAEISTEGAAAIDALAPALSRIKNAIDIAGHADPRPLPGEGAFISNWHLSLARAAAVAAQFRQRGYERDLGIEGYSSARFEEMSDDIPEEDRLSQSRRVDIVILGNGGKIEDALSLQLQ